jgi:hypothetical protein
MKVFASRREKPAWSLGDKAIENRCFEIAKIYKSPDPVVETGKNIGIGKCFESPVYVARVSVILSMKTLISSAGHFRPIQSDV